MAIKKQNFSISQLASKYSSKTTYKPDRFLDLGDAFLDATGLPGPALGHINMFLGHSDTGKTTALLEAAVAAQKMGVLPVFIVTEMKWNWEHAQQMGFEMEPVIDKETGEVIDYKGFFVYVDRGSLNTIEDVAAFIADMLNEQAKGKLPFDLLFLWDSVGSVPCRLSVESNKNNKEWNAGAMSQQFGNFINQKIILSRKENQPYTNTFVAVNKVWVAKPNSPMEMPKIKNKGGDTMFFDASLVVTFGNVTNSGTSKIKAVKDKKEVELTNEEKTAFQETMDEFVAEVSDLSDFGVLNMYPNEVQWSGKVIDFDIEFFFSIGENNGVYINGDMIKLDEKLTGLISKLTAYYDKFKAKWAKIISLRKKTKMKEVILLYMYEYRKVLSASLNKARLCVCVFGQQDYRYIY